jgi:hypothetical protein
MLRIIVFVLLVLFISPSFQCKKNGLSGCYKARLELKGVCMNYTIKVLEGNIDTSLIEKNWTNPANGVTYQNVFGLGSVCDFPGEINQGDEFYFQIGNRSNNGCAVCLAYYPTPQKKLSITVSKKPCN